ncbi:DUF2071 domain-containing protein [Micromonospora sp. NPDC049559]|uniref:YqjF family protein n=1 Tax=Micromonospora sp. NPDC049559 TaxID=3155923 RepID=UPI00343A1092
MKAPPSPAVRRPVMYHRWSRIAFLHWRYPTETLQALVPAPLTVQTCDGSAWVGLTPFLMRGVRAPGVPALPWLSRFPETNVRTYVRDPSGRSGIWFFSLDAARLPAVLAARAGYALPYFWSEMAVRVDGDVVSYRSRRRWPSTGRGRRRAELRLGPALAEPEYDALAHFLTARYRLFSKVAGRLVAAEVEHPPWPLRHAEPVRLDQDLLTSAGIPAPDTDPLVHASDGVPVRVGIWHR